MNAVLPLLQMLSAQRHRQRGNVVSSLLDYHYSLADALPAVFWFTLLALPFVSFFATKVNLKGNQLKPCFLPGLGVERTPYRILTVFSAAPGLPRRESIIHAHRAKNTTVSSSVVHARVKALTRSVIKANISNFLLFQ